MLCRVVPRVCGWMKMLWTLCGSVSTSCWAMTGASSWGCGALAAWQSTPKPLSRCGSARRDPCAAEMRSSHLGSNCLATAWGKQVFNPPPASLEDPSEEGGVRRLACLDGYHRGALAAPALDWFQRRGGANMERVQARGNRESHFVEQRARRIVGARLGSLAEGRGGHSLHIHPSSTPSTCLCRGATGIRQVGQPT